MARTKGSYTVGGTLEVEADAPADARLLVKTKADLTASGSFPYKYIGMIVSVESEQKAYMLIASDTTQTASWQEMGSDITVDDTPTAESTNPVSSGGVYDALEDKADLVNGKVPSSQLPSYVDDVIEGYYKTLDGRFYEEDTYITEIPGEAGKSYVDLSTNKSYRWTGSAFVRVDEGVSLGETSATAYRGDRGKTAYEDSQANKQNIGDLTDLQTSAKTNLVDAINEAATSGGSLANAVTSNLAVGAIESGTTIAKGTSFTEFVQKLLITEIAPTISFSASGSGVKEVGTSVTPTLSLTISNAGTGTPVSIKFYNGSTLIDTQSYISGTNTYTYTMEAVTTTTTVKGVLEYKKSDNTDANVEKTASYTFVMASYYGAVATAPTDKAGIIALTKNVKNTKALTTTFNLSNQKSCYCYPASFGNLTSIKDANNFEYLSSYTKTNVTVDDVSYNVYTLTDPVTATGFKQVYA